MKGDKNMKLNLNAIVLKDEVVTTGKCNHKHNNSPDTDAE